MKYFIIFLFFDGILIFCYWYTFHRYAQQQQAAIKAANKAANKAASKAANKAVSGGDASGFVVVDEDGDGEGKVLKRKKRSMWPIKKSFRDLDFTLKFKGPCINDDGDDGNDYDDRLWPVLPCPEPGENERHGKILVSTDVSPFVKQTLIRNYV